MLSSLSCFWWGCFYHSNTLTQEHLPITGSENEAISLQSPASCRPFLLFPLPSSRTVFAVALEINSLWWLSSFKKIIRETMRRSNKLNSFTLSLQDDSPGNLLPHKEDNFAPELLCRCLQESLALRIYNLLIHVAPPPPFGSHIDTVLMYEVLTIFFNKKRGKSSQFISSGPLAPARCMYRQLK